MNLDYNNICNQKNFITNSFWFLYIIMIRLLFLFLNINWSVVNPSLFLLLGSAPYSTRILTSPSFTNILCTALIRRDSSPSLKYLTFAPLSKKNLTSSGLWRNFKTIFKVEHLYFCSISSTETPASMKPYSWSEMKKII